MGNRDDLFGDDDFGFEDEDDLFGSEDDEFDLEEDETDFAFDEDDEDVELDSAFGLSGGEVDEDFFDEEEEGGTNRTFIILALLMILLFVAGLVVVLILATRDSGPSQIDMTRTEIAMLNAADETAFAISQTEAFEAQQTQEAALFAGQTATAEWEATNIPLTLTAEAEQTSLALTSAFQTEEAGRITPTPTPDLLTIQQTQQAGLTATADFLTAQAGGETPTPPAPSTLVGVSDVELTATAIAAIFQTPVGGADETPIGGPGDGQGGGGQPILPTAIPDTGLFDGTNNGASLGIMALIAFALVSVIFGARSLRAANERKL